MKTKLIILLVLLVAGLGIWIATRSPVSPPEGAAPTGEISRTARPPGSPEAPQPKVAVEAAPDAPLPEPPTGAQPAPAPSAPADRFVRPDLSKSPQPDLDEARNDVENISLMLKDFRTVQGENPTGSNAEIMKAVMGGNKRQAQLGPPTGQNLNGEGELVDRWGTPVFFHQMSATEMEIRSAGPDRKMWTGDDVFTK